MTKTVLITGSAVRIGESIARHLAAKGYAIGLHCHASQENAERLAKDIRDMGVACEIAVADLESENASREIFTSLKALPPIELLIHNASKFEKDSLATLSRDSFASHMRVNLETPLKLTKKFTEQLPLESSGQVICLLDGMKGWSLSSQFLSYSLSRMAMQSAIELLAGDLAPRIRLNGIALGATLPGKQDSEHTFDKLRELTPLKRVSSAKEVCHAIDFLIAAEGCTGQVIDLSGGMQFQPYRRPA